MLSNKFPTETRNLLVPPRPIEVVLAEDGTSPLTMVFPPLEDILEMEALENTHFSLKELAATAWSKLEQVFASELVALERKNDRFFDSPTFLTRLADLADLAGSRDREEKYIQRGRELGDDNAFAHRLAENFLARGELQKAEALFARMDLRTDVYANLHLAHVHLQRQDVQAASALASKAVSIDPLHFGARLFEGALRLVRGEYKLAVQSFRIAALERQNSAALFSNMALAYVLLRKPDRALMALRRSVALDPLNENAVAFLADLAFSENRNEDAVPSLRYLIGFEQKNPLMWARLARALLELGEFNEAIAALKRQGSLEDTAGVWNNLGVAYYRRRDRPRALVTFRYAMQKDIEKRTRDYFLAARNVALMLAENRDYEELRKFTGAIIVADKNHSIRYDKELSDVCVFHIHALSNLGENRKATLFAEQLLSDQLIADSLKAWVAGVLIAHYALEENGAQKAIDLVKNYESLLGVLKGKDAQRRTILANNIVFAYAEAGQHEEAERYMRYLTDAVHKEPYPTATLGLLNIRKGHLERGQRLYEEAVHLAQTQSDKKRIRQKLQFELGAYWLTRDPSRARRYLQKVIDQKEGAPQLIDAGERLLRRLPSR